MHPIIHVEDLHAARGAGAVTLLDVRYRMGGPDGPPEFAAGHIPGARYVDLDAALAAPAVRIDGRTPRGRHPLPDPEVFGAAMRAAGVHADAPVVVYDDWSGHAAARCWWLLRHHGHPDVRVLDGGWAAWTASGGGVETGGPDDPVASGDFVARPGGMPVVEADGVGDLPVLLDARAPARYAGLTEPLDPVAGHIPGALNFPSTDNLDEAGRFRPVAQLRAAYADLGVVPGVEVGVYCGSGVTAALDVLALELIGVRAALYPGSWSEWVADPDRPAVTGPRRRT
ncbi:sulfurtransferase [Nocardioides sambongensis]|uniref:sulfurtransferase n=1 Tax=Nocardioides sambongensis TaxID=2589074 RepID=UPI00112B1A65|nr:sulfurtransferase [Nocardioides sambongensis]